MTIKLPDTGRRRALIVVDVQPAFIKPHNEHITGRIARLIERVPYDAYIDAVYHSEAGSLWDRQQDYTAPLSPDTRTIDEVAVALKSRQSPQLHVVKQSRSVFKGDQNVEGYLAQHGIQEVHVVGTETHDCVLATAHSAFDGGWPVYVLEEFTEAATPGRHDDGLKLLRYQSMTNNSCRATTTEVEL